MLCQSLFDVFAQFGLGQPISTWVNCGQLGFRQWGMCGNQLQFGMVHFQTTCTHPHFTKYS
ncbi:Uncharacterised protein [Mycobacteroides abscessus subsp. abscessus]|nr:Uncharacterised protein [Mycobacteroides abscessus subsp. abscessus]